MPDTPILTAAEVAALPAVDAVPEGAVLVATMYAPCLLGHPLRAALVDLTRESVDGAIQEGDMHDEDSLFRPVAVEYHEVPGRTEVELLDPLKVIAGPRIEYVVQDASIDAFVYTDGQHTNARLGNATRYADVVSAVEARNATARPFARVLPVRVVEQPTRRVRHVREVR